MILKLKIFIIQILYRFHLIYSYEIYKRNNIPFACHFNIFDKSVPINKN